MGWHARRKLEHLTPDQRQHLPDTHNLLEPAHNDDQNANPKLAQLLSWGNKHAVLPPATSIR